MMLFGDGRANQRAHGLKDDGTLNWFFDKFVGAGEQRAVFSGEETEDKDLDRCERGIAFDQPAKSEAVQLGDEHFRDDKGRRTPAGCVERRISVVKEMELAIQVAQ